LIRVLSRTPGIAIATAVYGSHVDRSRSNVTRRTFADAVFDANAKLKENDVARKYATELKM